MPRLIDDDDPYTQIAEAALAAREEFEAGFKRSAKGNFWRIYKGLALTAFRRYGRWGWCIAGPDGKQFSRDMFDKLDDCISNLWFNTGQPDWW